MRREELRLPKNSFDSLYYEQGRKNSEEENKQSVAKSVTSRESGNVLYYVLDYAGTLADPWTADFFRLRRAQCKWRQVSGQAFEYYLKFLEKGERKYLHFCEREM